MIDQLKKRLSTHLLKPWQLQQPQGIPTGHTQLDQFLFWKGFPCAKASLLQGAPGLGATSLWLCSAQRLTQSGGWAAWVNCGPSSLFPWAAQQRKCDLSRLLFVSAPQEAKKFLWVLQELLTLSLFSSIACDITHVPLRPFQLVRLQKILRERNCALVFLSHKPLLAQSHCQGYQSSPSFLNRSKGQQNRLFPQNHFSQKAFYLPPQLFSLILTFQKEHLIIERAQHKPTPKTLQRRDLYADFMPQFTRKHASAWKQPDLSLPKRRLS